MVELREGSAIASEVAPARGQKSSVTARWRWWPGWRLKKRLQQLELAREEEKCRRWGNPATMKSAAKIDGKGPPGSSIDDILNWAVNDNDRGSGLWHLAWKPFGRKTNKHMSLIPTAKAVIDPSWNSRHDSYKDGGRGGPDNSGRSAPVNKTADLGPIPDEQHSAAGGADWDQ